MSLCCANYIVSVLRQSRSLRQQWREFDENSERGRQFINALAASRRPWHRLADQFTDYAIRAELEWKNHLIEATETVMSCAWGPCFSDVIEILGPSGHGLGHVELLTFTESHLQSQLEQAVLAEVKRESNYAFKR